MYVTEHLIQCRTAIQHVCDCVYICICVYIHTDLARGYLSHVITPIRIYTLNKKVCYIPGLCVFFVIISNSSVREV